MPNILDATGLQTQSRTELVSYYTAQYQAIYGADINLSSDTPDGQMMNIQIQTILDLLDLVTQVFNTFDPDTAIGVILDQRVAINGIQRQAGSYTVTPITLVNTVPVNLYGLDQTAQDVFTIADSANNKWYLMQTQISYSPGTHSLNFRAATIGKQLTTLNTITTIVTAVPGVTSVNNSLTYLSLGVNEEQDATLKVRRQRSVSISSQGYYQGLKAALENLPGVTSAFIYENNTDSPDFPDGTPGHSIWVVVAGSGLPSDIARTIYVKRNAGAGMRGTQSYVITQVDGSFFTVRWDNVTLQNLFIVLVLDSINGTVPPNTALIRSQLPNYLKPGVYETVNFNEIATYVQQIDPNALVTSGGFTNGQQQDLATSGYTPATGGTYMVQYNGNNSVAINWNDALAVIQVKIRAIAGLGSAVVSGLSSVNPIILLSVTLSSDPYYNVLGLLKIKNNTLTQSGGGALAMNNLLTVSNKLTPTQKINQFLIQSQNIVLTPLALSPSGASTTPNGTIQYTAAGGYGSYSYSLQSDTTGGASISVTGLYTAGPNPGSSYIKAVDENGSSQVVVASVANA